MTDRNRSIGDVLSDIVDDVQQIVRAEVRLARAEIREKLGRARFAAIFFATAGVAAVMAFGLVLLAGVFALATVWPAWAAALAVAAGTALLGGLLWMAGIRRIRALHVTPQKTIDSIKENIQWAKTRT
jgi:uncharacterized membrane protein YqjE